VPDSAASLGLIVDDPDAPVGTFTHWLAWGIDPAGNGLAEGERAPREGRNDFGRTGYGGPCPPPGHGRHRYVFCLYALAVELAVRPGVGRREAERALEDGVLERAELVGTYKR
jgi:Raf kinase inhibitor-like YbhB/YbcL family protein